MELRHKRDCWYWGGASCTCGAEREHIGTHWEGCETERHHHQCAIARLEEARAQLAAARERSNDFRAIC